MPVYDSMLRPLLWRISPERSHALAHRALRWSPPWRALSALRDLRQADPRLRTEFAGVTLPNPVGLAAGFDKDCDLLDALSCLGFGFVTVGSIMPEPRRGNPRPRMVRYPETESLADSMGVPSRGRAHAVERLRRFERREVPIFANVGGFSGEALAAGIADVAPHVDAVEVSLMCPNVQKGHGPDAMALLCDVLERVDGHDKPLVVRVPNDVATSGPMLAEMIDRCVDAGVAGLKIGGGRPVVEPRLGAGRGTLHGRAIFETALANVERAAHLARGRIPIKGNGGVSSAADVVAMRRAGAVCVDLYSAFVFRGPTVAREINRELLELTG